ncbi:MAG: hypothetical protein QG604_955 [Candidatus Dependentiae bacterium]|nr:hypothetical protein [Candidatus Dependentiae bacterium]
MIQNMKYVMLVVGSLSAMALMGATNDLFEAKNGVKGLVLLSKEVPAAEQLMSEYGWLNGPSWGDVAKAGIWTAASVSAMWYISRVLKRDKHARMIKLKKQQQAMGGINPMAQILRAMQMQQNGLSAGEGMDDGFEEQAAAPVAPEVLEWNPDDILTPGKRRFLEIFSWVATGMSVLTVVNLVDRCKDKYHGNTVPSAIRNRINWFVNVEKEFAKSKEKINKNPGFTVQVAYELDRDEKLEVAEIGNNESPATADFKLRAGRKDVMMKVLKGAGKVKDGRWVKAAHAAALPIVGGASYKWHDLLELGRESA